MRERSRRSWGFVRRRGTSYLEVTIASVVFALTLTGLGATFVSQERLMQAVERRVSVLAGTGVDVTISGFSPPNSYPATRAIAHPGDDLLGRIDAWAARLGASEMVNVDGRPRELPITATPTPWAVDSSALTWTPADLPPATPDRLFSVGLLSRTDDGASAVAIATLDALP